MQKTILYFDCFSGASGDMIVGALLDLGVKESILLAGFKKLKLTGYKIQIGHELKSGINGTRFKVSIKKDKNKTDRNLSDINKIIRQSKLQESIKKTALDIFLLLARSEAKIHQKKINAIHFHEVGAVDSILDIVGASICLNALNADELLASPLNLGNGFVRCEHGLLPVPAPATLEILKGIPVYSSGTKLELTTPTGAAILKTVCSSFIEYPCLQLEKIGYGIGTADLEHPNVLRVVLGRMENIKTYTMLETNLDNMNPEIYSYLFEKFFKSGALDFFITPIIMKKNRPGVIVSVLCEANKVEELTGLFIQETTTLGIRKYQVRREEIKRELLELKTRYGMIHIKVGYYNGKVIKYAPEYEDCKKIAESQGLPLQRVYRDVMADIEIIYH